MTISARGHFGAATRSASSSPSDPARTSSVVALVSGRFFSVAHSSCTYEPSGAVTPNSLCDWSMMIPIEKPSTKPAITAFDRNVETQPIRRTPKAT